MTDLNHILELIKAGEKPQARQAIIDLLADEPQNEQAWLYLASCATNKREFEVALQQVLKLNPLNGQAIKLAQQYQIPMPEAAQAMIGKSAKPVPKSAKKVIRSLSDARRQRNRRLILLLAFLILIPIAAFVLFLRGGDETESVSTGEPTEALSPEATEEVTPEATEEVTPEATEEVTPEATEEVTPEATEEVTPEATEEVTPEATEEVTPEATEEVTPEATEEVTPEVTPEATEALLEVAFVAGTSETQLENLGTYPADAPVYLQLDFAERSSDLRIEIELQAPDDSDPLIITQDLVAGEAETLLLPLKTAEDVWVEGLWRAKIVLNGQAVEQIQTFITPIVTPTATSQFPEIVPNVRLFYSPEFLSLKNISEENINISELRFVQQIPNQEFVFEVAEWQAIFGSSQSLGTTYALQPESCFQTGVSNGPASTLMADCLRLNSWVVAADDGLFWLINNGNVRKFLVFLGPLPIAECEIDAGECEFGVPQVEE